MESMILNEDQINETLEILTQLAEGKCNCDCEYIDSIPYGRECLPCRAGRFLDTIEEK